VKHAVRGLLKTPAFSLAAILVLALGIGANTAIFNVVDAVLLRPLPYKDAGRLVRIWHVPPPKSFPGVTTFSVSPANYLDWERQNHVFSQMAIYGFASFNVTGGSQPQALRAGRVSRDFFSVLGVQPMLGRGFTPDEQQPGRSHVVVLGHAIWQTQFGADAHVVGRQIRLDGQPYTVVGVMPASFRLPGWAQLWTPLGWSDAERAVRGNHNYLVIGRLGPGATLATAQAEMDTISARLQRQYPADDAGWGAIVLPLHDDMVSGVRTALLMLLGAVVFVLLIACANVANLVLGRSLARRREIAIRSALGASRARVLGQMLMETVILAIAGGALGLAIAHVGTEGIVRVLGDRLPASVTVALDVPVLLFALAISVLTGLLAGLFPAWRLTRARLDLGGALKQRLGNDGDAGGRRTRNLLVGFEVACSLILLVGAGLMLRSLLAIGRIDPGFDPQHVLTAVLPVSSAHSPDAASVVTYLDRIVERVRSQPGVEAAGFIDSLPLTGGSTQPIAFDGRPVLPMSEQPEVPVRVISPGYMEAMHIALTRGRRFTDADRAGRPPVAIISESMARRFWPHQDPIGQHITLTFYPGVSREIVGIVADTKIDQLQDAGPASAVYYPLDQITTANEGEWTGFAASLVVRTAPTPATMIDTITAGIHAVDPTQPVADVQTMEEVVGGSILQQELNAALLATFAGLALLLATIGIYSVLAYTVRRRRREIGIRLALGAQLRDVIRLVIVEGMRPTLIGIAVGLAGAFALGRLLSSLIYGVSASDPVTFAAVALLLAAVAVAASVIPALQAARVDPVTTLRDE
jgi:predicted permease